MNNFLERERVEGLDPSLWFAFAAGGPLKKLEIGKNVIFFPQGYQEQAYGIVDSESIPSSIQYNLLCRVLGIEYLAHLVTDEVYVKIKLIPVSENDCNGNGNGDDVKKVESYAKTLTQSDANNGGGFSVPRRCADTIFPQLNFRDKQPQLNFRNKQPSQNIKVKDVHGKIWTFRHIYRGNPKRHLLTTGWSGFVNNKNLVSGDTIVFAIDNNGDIRVGIRRRKRGVDGENQVQSVWNEKKVSPESVIESLNLASKGEAFEVIYFPRANNPAFCVNAMRVSRSLSIPWRSGFRCRIELENEDSLKKSWFNGTITSIQVFDPIQWKYSPWKSIKVKWDIDDLDNLLLKNVEFVSPWMIELIVLTIPQINLSSHSRKKPRLDSLTPPPQPPPMFSGGYRQGFVPFKDYYYNLTPAGMQGARQDPNGSSSSSSIANSSNLYDYSTPVFPESKNLAAASEVVTAGKEEDEDDSSYFVLFGVKIKKPLTQIKLKNHPDCVSIAADSEVVTAGEVITAEKEEGKDDSNRFMLFGVWIEKPLAQIPSREDDDDDDKGDENEEGEKSD